MLDLQKDFVLLAVPQTDSLLGKPTFNLVSDNVKGLAALVFKAAMLNVAEFTLTR